MAYSDGASFRIPFELLRVYSPSAEVQGHGPGQEVLQTGKCAASVAAAAVSAAAGLAGHGRVAVHAGLLQPVQVLRPELVLPDLCTAQGYWGWCYI